MSTFILHLAGRYGFEPQREEAFLRFANRYITISSRIKLPTYKAFNT